LIVLEIIHNMSQLCFHLLLLLFALATLVPSNETTTAFSESWRLIETSETNRQWMTESEARHLKGKGVNFMDVTDFLDLDLHSIKNTVTLPTILTIGAAPVSISIGAGLGEFEAYLAQNFNMHAD